jgi:hypothetical protein
MTDEERRQQRREAGLKGARTKGKERLRESALKRAQTMGKERLRQAVLKAMPREARRSGVSPPGRG